jgi:glycosyltransferase involved in cell wall biosynthesis
MDNRESSMRIKVCHFTSGHEAHDARIFHKQCRTLASADYDVHLVVPVGVTEVRDGVNICSIGAENYGRVQRMLSVSKKVYEKALSIDADIYHFHDPELIPLGLKLKKLGKKVIYDSHEDTPADILNKAWIPRFLRSLVSKIYKLYEERSVQRFDAVVSVTPHYVDRFRKANVNSHLVTNYPILDELPPLKTEIHEGIDKNICFIGRVCDESMQRNIVKAVNGVEGVRYICAGPADKDYLEELSLIPGWEFCDYRGPIAFSDAHDFVSQGIAGLQITDYIPNFGYNIGSLGNTKMFTYMLAGLPVICTDMILWKEIMDENQCGLCVNPHDIGAIREAIEFVRDNPERATQMGKNGREAVLEKYNWSTQVPNLLNLYSSII